VCGIDHSKLMVRRARRRNRAAVRAGVLDVRVRLRRAPAPLRPTV
jgi:hypothetical protein